MKKSVKDNYGFVKTASCRKHMHSAKSAEGSISKGKVCPFKPFFDGKLTAMHYKSIC